VEKSERSSEPMKDPRVNVRESSRNCLCAVVQNIRPEQRIIVYSSCRLARDPNPLDAKEMLVNRIVYIVGAIVIIVALLSFFGLR
jgi:predicted membrane channel-forming protein YqfA (hemolysin III family)